MKIDEMRVKAFEKKMRDISFRFRAWLEERFPKERRDGILWSVGDSYAEFVKECAEFFRFTRLGELFKDEEVFGGMMVSEWWGDKEEEWEKNAYDIVRVLAEENYRNEIEAFWEVIGEEFIEEVLFEVLKKTEGKRSGKKK